MLHYFSRGRVRSDGESSLTCGSAAAPVCGLAALAWKPDVALLATRTMMITGRATTRLEQRAFAYG